MGLGLVVLQSGYRMMMIIIIILLLLLLRSSAVSPPHIQYFLGSLPLGIPLLYPAMAKHS